jgi:predicted MFS family arabinose efflux permease
MNKKLLILILGLNGFIVMADNWVVSPILPAISEDIGISVTNAGLLISAYMIPFGIFQIIFGPLADRFGKKKIINTSMIVFTLATALCAIGTNLTDLSIYRALTGVFAAAVMPISLALIGDIFPMQERQSAIGTFMGISFLGQGLSMAIGGSISYFLNWRGVFALYAVMAVLTTTLLMTAGRNIPSSANPDAKFFAPYKMIFSKMSNIVLYLSVIFEGVLIIGTFSYLGGFLDNEFHFNYLMIGFVMTLFGLFAVVGGRLSGKLAMKVGRYKVLITGIFLAASAVLLLHAFGANLATTMTAIGMLGLGFMFTHSSLLTIATEAAPKARGAVMSLVAFCFMGGGGVGTAVGGKIIERSGYDALFSLYGYSLIFLFFFVAVLLRNKTAEVNCA